MRKVALLCLSVLSMCFLSGCNQSVQVEDMAYAVMLSADLTEADKLEVAVVVPKISGNGGESSGAPEQSGQLVYSASGDTFSEAIEMLRWAVPRRLDLSQVELIVISESLAQSPQFPKAGPEMIHYLYSAARLAVCSGSAKEFISEEKPQIGSDVATEFSAMFEDYAESGFIPDTSFADFYYKTVSVYSDPLAIYAEQADEAVGAILSFPDMQASVLVDAQQANRYLGSVVFKDGCMIGTLNGQETLCCLLLRGAHMTFPCTVDGVSLELSTLGIPRVFIDIMAEPVRICVKLDFSVLPGSGHVDSDRIAQQLEDDLQDVIGKCKILDVEPFEFAEHAAVSFYTIEEWLDFEWHERFSESNLEFEIAIHSEHS